MKALTLTQPWASAVMKEIKQWETRSWLTNYRGPLAIHAAKGVPGFARDFAKTEFMLGRIELPMPLGAVLGIVELVDCRRTEEAANEISQDEPRRWGLEHLYGDWSAGRYAWKLRLVEVFAKPIPAKGALALWEWAV